MSEMTKLVDYAFVDCLFVDYAMDRLSSVLSIVVEAFYPQREGGQRKKGLLRITFSGIEFLQLTKNAEFDLDIQLPYNSDGDDVRANEIYSIIVEEARPGVLSVVLSSDMLAMSARFTTMDIREIDVDDMSQPMIAV